MDVGSTTAKIVVMDEAGHLLLTDYKRHNAKARDTLLPFLKELMERTGDADVSVQITGSIGMGIAERCGLPFVQEVVAATKAIQKAYPAVRSMIDIGGEDAKIVFFKDAEATDLRMNGNCAGGTGAFIDQMAVILGTDIEELNRLALNATTLYPIASRCGVFCKTDIQNLIAKNVCREDIAASIFHAVAVQTIITLAHGYDIQHPILFCGGPLTFIPALRKAFTNYLKLQDRDIILPENGALLPATGAALSASCANGTMHLSDLITQIDTRLRTSGGHHTGLTPVFQNADDYQRWQERISHNEVVHAPLKEGSQDVFIGIDSGSTTTKIVVLDNEHRLLYSYYQPNGGNPIQAVADGLAQLQTQCEAAHTTLRIMGSCSTGYGEDLIKAAFQLNHGIVETIAHYMAAHYLNPQVSFILDIGGQDMKAIFVNNGIIDRIEINEACSSGCGSFIETFAKTLGYTAQDFSTAACQSSAPCDLGTRCTVFMNSKVKQVLREGATINDIAAGLAYSVIKNCLYKVLKLKDTASLGQHIVVQGGTMRNDAIVRSLELLTGTEVTRCNIPELMGAFGCALYAMQHPVSQPAGLDNILSLAQYTTHTLHCKGCDNHCLVTRYDFQNGQKYYSGNRCEKVFSNNGSKENLSKSLPANLYARKYDLLFNRQSETTSPRGVIGLPRCLNMYEEYPFWHTLFTRCGLQVCLSQPSDFSHYEQNACMVMSDNICFPAKLVHSHIQNLIEKKVDRIFMPFVLFEHPEKKEQNSYNCPIVTGYTEVVKSVQSSNIPIDAPTISFKDRKLLLKQCTEYLETCWGIDRQTVAKAFAQAEEEQNRFAHSLAEMNEEVWQQAQQTGEMCILLAGRPYHTDPLIQHRVAGLLTEMGIHVLTDDLVRYKDIDLKDVHFMAQWAYPNRILKAACWCATQGENVQFVEMTSFGCGPDAFLTDSVRDLLMRHHKTLTLLKLDDINNVGSMKLRVRSLIESMKLSQSHTDLEFHHPQAERPFVTSPVYDKQYRDCKIIVPYFTPFLSPLIPAIMSIAGYDVDNLPLSNTESCDWGLKYANNEVCYPATLIVGDIIKAFKSGKYDPDRTVVAMTQTGGQCRASNYVSLIKKALVDAGYTKVPVVSMTFGDSLDNYQPGFKINWMKLLPPALRSILFSDSIAKLYYATVVRESRQGEAVRLKEHYLQRAEGLIRAGRSKELFPLLEEAVQDFNAICLEKDCPRVGVVGEIFLKFNPFAQKNIIDWLIAQGIEVVPPIMADFFMQTFVNRQVNIASHVDKSHLPPFLISGEYKLVKKQFDKVNRIGREFRYFLPFQDIFQEAEEAEKVINLNAQFGEGWLLPAEVMSYAKQGIHSVVSLQPFGCIANHIVARGVEKRIKALCPDINLLSLDFDSGVSDVNITNRLLLFIDNLRR